MSEIITRAQAKLSSFDPQARTVDVVLGTETPVRRRDYSGPFDEILTVSRQAIDTSRLDSMPLLDSHDAYSGLDSRLGSIVSNSLRFEGKTAIVTAKISRNPKGEALFRDLEDGHVMGVSVGYRIDTQERTEAPAGGTAIVRATRWTPMEISIVSVPADPAASTRALDNEKDSQMPQANTQTQDDQSTRAMSVREARGFAAELTQTGDNSRFAAELQTRIKRGMTEAEIRAELLDLRASDEDKSPTFPHSSIQGVRTRSIGEAMSDALMCRINPSHKPENDAREFVGLSVPELARRCLEHRDHSTIGMSHAQLVTRALHSTSDFPIILSNLANKQLQTEFQAVPSALKSVARQSTARDFKAKTVIKFSSAPGLLPVTESGEYQRGTMVEDQESYRISTFGRIFGITRHALVNDDLGAFTSMAAKLGQAASVFESKFLVDLLQSNPVMSDGKAIFHPDHKNLATTGAAPDQATLEAARKSFRQQVSLSDATYGAGGDLVNLAPRYLIVGPEYETVAERLLTTINATTTSDVNPFASRLSLVVEPRLVGKAWYLAADPATCEGLEYAYLEGEPGPQIETRNGFDVDGMEIKVRLDFGAAFLEHRGWYKNPGPA